MKTLWPLHVWCTSYHLFSCLDDDVCELGFVPIDYAMACCYSPPTSTVRVNLIWYPLHDLMMVVWLGYT